MSVSHTESNDHDSSPIWDFRAPSGEEGGSNLAGSPGKEPQVLVFMQEGNQASGA